ncbi:lachesin-like isoform X2 [Aphis gossypii]|uniref:lachesin-like isoform X2 n=1 Tax=Aphis gossypii TaxID=80765 RepID=UPI002158EDA2|nr:lachesin-like isoform X2 [Aphis gossypii]
MKNIYGILLLLCINLACFQKSESISNITRKIVKDIGDEVYLDCSTINNPEVNVVWVKVAKDQIDESIVLSSKSTLIVDDPRVTLISELKQDSNRYIIHIHNIQESDTSIYRCDVITGINEKVSYYTELLVGRSPFFYDNSTKSLVVVEGQSVQLACFAGGYPTPRVFWWKRKNAILFIGNILKLSAVKKEHRGDYYCKAENNVGNGTSHKISLEVEFAPVVTALETSVGQAVLYDAYLECHVEANPQPAITWIYNGVELSNNQHYLISDFATNDNNTDSFLLIMKINYELYETLLPQCPPAC